MLPFKIAQVNTDIIRLRQGSLTDDIPCTVNSNETRCVAERAIAEKARQMNLGNPRPESPRPNQTPPPRNQGYWQAFERGSVYWTRETGAKAVLGDIFQKWASLGWEQGLLGFPTTDETSTPDGVGRFNAFQYGSIYWTPRTGAHEVHGTIFEKWASLGWERSSLGYPTTDELACQQPNSQDRYQIFEGGRIYWRAATNEATVFNNPTNIGDGGNCTAAAASGGGTRPVLNPRRITAGGRIEIVDDESFGGDEYNTVNVNSSIGVSSNLPQPLLDGLEGCAGDEVRVVIDVDAALADSDAVIITGNARLYEGTDCATTDLEQEKIINIRVPAGAPVTSVINLINADEGGDTAKITLTFTNQPE